MFCFEQEQQQQQQQSGGDAVTADAAAAERLKGELVQLRAAIRAARSEVRQTHAQIAAMDRDLAVHGALPASVMDARQMAQNHSTTWRCMLH